jgi:hypothetical protein
VFVATRSAGSRSRRSRASSKRWPRAKRSPRTIRHSPRWTRSGSIGTAVHRAIAERVPLIAKAPADAKTRDASLERLFEAHQKDQIPYIERLADHWGELCASKGLASAWSDRRIGITQLALSRDKNRRGHFHGTKVLGRELAEESCPVG